MSYAITHAAQTTVPVTWTSNGNVITVENWPTNFHAAYASDSHVATVTQLADTPQQAPAMAPAGIGGTVGMSGGALVGLGIVIWFVARWRHHSKEIRTHFFLGVIATVLVGSWGLFGTVTQTVKTTGDSVGSSVGTTIGQTR